MQLSTTKCRVLGFITAICNPLSAQKISESALTTTPQSFNSSTTPLNSTSFGYRSGIQLQACVEPFPIHTKNFQLPPLSTPQLENRCGVNFQSIQQQASVMTSLHEKLPNPTFTNCESILGGISAQRWESLTPQGHGVAWLYKGSDQLSCYAFGELTREASLPKVDMGVMKVKSGEATGSFVSITTKLPAASSGAGCFTPNGFGAEVSVSGKTGALNFEVNAPKKGSGQSISGSAQLLPMSAELRVFLPPQSLLGSAVQTTVRGNATIGPGIGATIAPDAMGLKSGFTGYGIEVKGRSVEGLHQPLPYKIP